MIKTLTFLPIDCADEDWLIREETFRRGEQDLADYHAWLEDRRLEEILTLDFEFSAEPRKGF